MQLVQSLEQYKGLIKATKTRVGNVASNNAQLPVHMEPYITQGRLSFEEQDGGLVMWLDEGAYQTVYLWWGSNGAPLTDTAQETPLVAELMERAGVQSASERRIAETLERAGFVHERTNLQFILALEELGDLEGHATAARAALEQRSSLRVERCETEDLANRVVALWDKRLDVADLPLDHRDFLHHDDLVLCAVDRDGTVAGAYWLGDAGRQSCSGRHIVTDERYVRQGIASTLMLEAYAMVAKHGILTVTTWISDANTGSIALHGRLGFRKNGRVCVQYVLDR